MRRKFQQKRESLPRDWMRNVDAKAIREQLQVANRCMQLMNELVMLGVKEDRVN